MDIDKIREECRKASEQSNYWKGEVDRLSSELSQAEEELRPHVFELILEKKLSECSGNIFDISEQEYLDMCSENKLSYVVFTYFIRFVCERANENGWKVLYYNKKEGDEFKLTSESEFHWTDCYDMMNTYAIRVIM